MFPFILGILILSSHHNPILLSSPLSFFYQHILNLDVLIGLPQSPKIPPGGTQTFPTQILGGAVSDFSTIELQLNEIQRILLRYNKQTKILFKKYSNYANVRRINDFLEIPVIPSILDNLTDFRPDSAGVIMAARGSQVNKNNFSSHMNNMFVLTAMLHYTS